ncbi:unnamed protein product [Anisakis simplex]|uniref:Protein kinase domain-containing protein n=1 Tax=Anisakis simplex TaxID=6269 RepID=A0A0M3K7A5_ANISI|nr:unnamed protein product [Anisakis simplex]
MKTAITKQQQTIDQLPKGCVKPMFVFVVMTLLGKDVYKLRNEQYERRFSLSTALRIGIHSCKAIQELHQCKFLSRDIKPSNYAVGLRENNQHKTIFLFDFGLARRFVDRSGKHVKSRGEVGWRGTNRYGSLNAHLRLDLSRRDDLESWFYMLVEISRGALPWRFVKEREAAEKAKKHARGAGRCELLQKCPKQYDEILKMIDALAFEEDPDYDRIYSLFDEVRESNHIKMEDRYDWEEESEVTSSGSTVGGVQLEALLQRAHLNLEQNIADASAKVDTKQQQHAYVRTKETLHA